MSSRGNTRSGIKSIYTMNKEIRNLMIKQYFVELTNSIFYAVHATIFQSQRLFGLGKCFKLHSAEETLHAKMFLEFFLEVKVSMIDGDSLKFNPTIDIKTDPFEIIFASLEQEKKNSILIDRIMQFAIEKNDFHLQAFLGWFIKEQIEEETFFEKILKKFEMLKDSPQMLYLIDKDMSELKK